MDDQRTAGTGRSDSDRQARGGRRRRYVILRPRSGPEPEPRERSLEEVAWDRFVRSRHELIAEAAYYRAEARGFREGSVDEDWLEAEAAIDAMLRRERAGGKDPAGSDA